MRGANLGAIVSLGMVGVAVALAVIISTPWGIGLSPDSAVYIGGARSLLRGSGFTLPTDSGAFAPIVHFPPLYSFILALLAVFGAEPLQGAQWLSALLFACNVVLAGVLGYAALGSIPLASLVVLFALTAFPMVQAHTMAWSEPLFILLQLAGTLGLLFYLRKPNRHELILTSVAFGCGVLVRYAGLAMLVAGIAGLLLLSEKEWRGRMIDAIVFATICFLPAVGWLVRNEWVAERLVNRSFFIHPISAEQIASVFRIVSGWLSFSWLTSFDPLGVSLVVLTLSGVTWLSIESRRNESTQLPPRSWSVPSINLLVVITLSYLITLLGSISFLDAQVPIDSRLLSPFYVPLLVLGLFFGARLWRSSQLSGVSRAIIALGLMLVLAAQAAASIKWLEFSYRDGVGYAGREWRNSETLAKLGSQPVAYATYSNAPDVLYILRGTAAVMIPRKVDPQTSRPNQYYVSEMAQVRRVVNEGKARLVYFNRISWRWYLPTADEVQDAIGLRPFARERDGVIYRVN